MYSAWSAGNQRTFHVMFACEQSTKTNDPSKVKRKFSSFFKSLVIELDKDLYGPDNHLVEVFYAVMWMQFDCLLRLRIISDKFVS